LFRPLYESFHLVTTQTERDAQRLEEVGCRESSLHVLGSMKFDSASVAPKTPVDAAGLLARAGRTEKGAITLVAGSTHAGEEVLLARVVERLRKEFPHLYLVLVPRHFERCREISEQLRAAGCRHVVRSSLPELPSVKPESSHCLLVDSTGELTAFYAEADAVFIGKSLCAAGGQNPIEPAALGKPLVFGLHMQNFAGVSQQLVSGQAAIQVSDESQLQEAFAQLLRSRETRSDMGRQALEIVRQNEGATRRTVELVARELEACWGARST